MCILIRINDLQFYIMILYNICGWVIVFFVFVSLSLYGHFGDHCKMWPNYNITHINFGLFVALPIRVHYGCDMLGKICAIPALNESYREISVFIISR